MNDANHRSTKVAKLLQMKKKRRFEKEHRIASACNWSCLPVQAVTYMYCFVNIAIDNMVARDPPQQPFFPPEAFLATSVDLVHLPEVTDHQPG